MSAIQQLLMRSGATAPGPLDSYTASLYGAYSLTKLLTAYAGSSVRVRRSSDNTEQDIGFSGLGLNTSALTTFAGAGDAFVTKWYDQSGNANDIVQATTTKQPKIYAAGVYLTNIQFNLSSVDQFLKGPTNGGAVASKSVFRRDGHRAFDTTNIEYEYGDSSLIGAAGGASQFQLAQIGGAPFYAPYLASNSGTAYYNKNYSRSAFNFSTNCFIVKKAQANAANTFDGYSNGSIVSGSGVASGSPTVTGNFPSYYWALGGRANGTLGSRLDILAFLIYDADKTTDVAAISTILAAL